MSDLNKLSEKLTQLIYSSDVLLENLRQQKFSTTSNLLSNFSSLMNDFFAIASKIFDSNDLSNILVCIQNIMDAQQRKDYLMLGDFLELELLPTLYELQGIVLENMEPEIPDYFEENFQLISRYPVCDQQLLSDLKDWYQTQLLSGNSLPYVVEPTGSGLFTLAKTRDNQKYYFHSNGNPGKEAHFFARGQLLSKTYNYTVFGLGFGYHISAMLLSDAGIQVTVLESDLNIIGLWLMSCDISFAVQSGRFRLTYLPQLAGLNDYLTESSSFVIHYPSLAAMEESPAKEALNKYFLHYSSVQEQKPFLDANFFYTQKRLDTPVDNIQNRFQGKTVIYFGGGPSTETKLPYIRNYISSHPDAVTVCAGKVYRALLDKDFIPDYVILTDPKPGLVWQTQNIPENGSELLYLATASYEAVNAFNGKRHVFYQKDYEESELFAHEHGYLLVSTGGSVSTAAIDLLLQLGCQKLITTGLDLAYPEGNTHAFGIQGTTSKALTYKTTTDINGHQIQTSPPLQAYQEWIERRIRDVKDVEFINVTDGVKIQGMKNGERL